jgi:hypothetical protein
MGAGGANSVGIKGRTFSAFMPQNKIPQVVLKLSTSTIWAKMKRLMWKQSGTLALEVPFFSFPRVIHQ